MYYFYGYQISKEEKEVGYLSYKGLASTLQKVLCNDILNDYYTDAELVSGWDYDEETDSNHDFYQYYITNEYGAKILEQANETIYYISKLNLYVWCVDHYGTPWSDVYTSIKVDN